MRICVFCDSPISDDERFCTRCNDYKGINEAWKCPSCNDVNPISCNKCNCGQSNPKAKAVRKPIVTKAKELELTNAARITREGRDGLQNYVPVMYGKTGWILDEEGGVTSVSTRNLAQAIKILGAPTSIELVPEGVVVVMEHGAYLATGFTWGYRGEGPSGLAKMLMIHTDLAKDLDEMLKMVSSWPKDKRGVIWGDGDSPICPFCQNPADSKGGCEECLGDKF